MASHASTPSDSKDPSSARATSAGDGLAPEPTSGGANRKRSIAQWLLLIAILILPW